LIITLVACLYDYKSLKKELTNNLPLVFSIIAFSIWIIVIGYYHSAPLRELDNYLRFLILLPILTIALNQSHINTILKLSALGGLLHIVFTLYDGDIERYKGTSSTAITYSYISATFFILSIFSIINSKEKSMLIMPLVCLIFLYIYIQTGTRGPLIGIIACLLFVLYKYKSMFLMYILIISLALITLTPNTLYERIQRVTDINIDNPIETKHRSLRERFYYYNFGMDLIKDDTIFGIGPQNIKPELSKKLSKEKINNIKPRDHLHNEFIDISAKFGLPSLVLFILIIYFTIKRTNENNYIVILPMIMILSSQLTQSYLAHHQATCFFIVFLYLSFNLIKNDRHDRI
jgi:O-antigen ligase